MLYTFEMKQMCAIFKNKKKVKIAKKNDIALQSCSFFTLLVWED